MTPCATLFFFRCNDEKKRQNGREVRKREKTNTFEYAEELYKKICVLFVEDLAAQKKVDDRIKVSLFAPRATLGQKESASKAV